MAATSLLPSVDAPPTDAPWLCVEALTGALTGAAVGAALAVADGVAEGLGGSVDVLIVFSAEVCVPGFGMTAATTEPTPNSSATPTTIDPRIQNHAGR